MAALSFVRRPLAIPSALHVALTMLAVTALSGCGSEDAPDSAAAGSGGSSGAGAGQAGTGGTLSAGGSGAFQGGTGGSSGQAGRQASGGKGSSTGAGGVVNGGQPGLGGSTSTAGKGAPSGPPDPSDDGSSPYERECHGDTVMCGDVEALRCLGIRDDTSVYGYSCSNTCETDADCSDAPASGDATAACVDFVTQKHCLLVCLSGGATHSCPAGMDCYVYPQSPIGYCLWQ